RVSCNMRRKLQETRAKPQQVPRGVTVTTPRKGKDVTALASKPEELAARVLRVPLWPLVTEVRCALVVRYQNGLFLPVPGVGSLEKAAKDHKDDELFLAQLDQFEAQGRHVSARVNANNYAPTMFSKATATSKARFADAMQRLFTANKIHVATYGKPSRQYCKIARGARQ